MTFSSTLQFIMDHWLNVGTLACFGFGYLWAARKTDHTTIDKQRRDIEFLQMQINKLSSRVHAVSMDGAENKKQVAEIVSFLNKQGTK